MLKKQKELLRDLPNTTFLRKNSVGFTLIEILIAVVIIAVLLIVMMSSVNPGTYLSRGRNTVRWSNITTILNAVGTRMADNKGVFETGCAAGAIPTVSGKMATGAGNYDIAQCLVPTYLPNMPYDPNAAGAHYTSNADYDTGYNIIQNAITKRITVNAPKAELGETISITR